MQEILGFSDNTRQRYKTNLEKYEEYTKLTLEELLEEAEAEEDAGIRKRKRKINQRIIGFKKHMETTTYTNPINGHTGKYSASTIVTCLKHIRSFYNVHEIEFPKIRNLPIMHEEKYEDTITREMIEDVLKNTNNLKHRAIILALSSSGIDGDTLRKLTWQDYITATDEYHYGGTFKDIITTLQNCNEVVPTFHSTRGKTNYEHIFFMSCEAVDAINLYALAENDKKEIDLNDPIFNISAPGFSKIFSRANDRLSIGRTSAGTRRKFHAHGLRRYFASTLIGTTVDGMMLDSLMIEFMLGHSIPATTESYYKKNPETLKNTYIKIMPKLSIEQVNVRDIDSKEYKQLAAKLYEYEKLDARVGALEDLKELFDSELFSL